MIFKNKYLKTENDIMSDARQQAQVQWNANPCGADNSDENSSKFFEEVETSRYDQQYWQKAFFDYSFSGGRVLEVGIGLGTDLKQFARKGAKCHGVDITDQHLFLTKKNFERERLRVTLHKCDAINLPYPENYFDCVYSFGVIHHIPDVDRVLDEIYRVLKPGGVFQVAVYNKFSIHTLTLFIRSIFSGRLAEIGVDGVLATIESGADGSQIKPYVKLYSYLGLKKLLENYNFKTRKIEIHQVNFSKPHPLSFLRLFERYLGWYICAQCEKPRPVNYK
ncbi:class I SAM-dependent methyltransferase [Alphaproteobacteria bacterium]|nr:class I SAM-dependent methyltransferase [Alphaproteobacteria bacterium]